MIDGFKPKIALVLGSGFGDFAAEVKTVATIPYAELPDFPQTSVHGHAGKLLLGHVGPTPVAVMQGRAHYYENGKVDVMAGAIRALAAMGCETLFQTNAAGSLRLDMPPGSLMATTSSASVMAMPRTRWRTTRASGILAAAAASIGSPTRSTVPRP